jgi:hypothetical protein
MSSCASASKSKAAPSVIPNIVRDHKPLFPDSSAMFVTVSLVAASN